MERGKPKIGAASRTKKKARRAVYQTKYNTERKDLETLGSVLIRNVKCLRLQRGWSNLIRILLVHSA